MFGDPGGLYVYFTYGMHWCANLVCGSVGAASAVLLRAGEVVDGLDLARARRAGVIDSHLADLARGPARLAMTLALGRDQNGLDALAPDSPFVARAAKRRPESVVCAGPRVGVSGPGGHATAYPWRFWLEGEATVSAYRQGKVAPSKPGARSAHP